MDKEKYIEIFGAIDLLKNRVELYNKYKRSLSEIIAYEKGIDLATCEPSISCKIFDEVNDILSKNSLGVEISNNGIANDGFVYFAEKHILDILNIISLNDIVSRLKELDKKTADSKIELVKKYLIGIILVSNYTINKDFHNIIDHIWEKYGEINPKIAENKIEPPITLHKFINVVTTATITDSSNLESLFISKIKPYSSENERLIMSEIYEYMPTLFDYYFNGTNIFEK